MTADDQVGVTGLLEGGAAFSIHYRGGFSRGTNLLWEINGTEGDLQLTAAGGQAQIFELEVRGGKGGSRPSRSCPCRRSIGGRRRKSRGLRPTSPKRMRVSPATIATERISAT